MTELAVVLSTLQRSDLALLEPWFEDPDTARYLGGPGRPAAMLALGEGAVGEVFGGAVQTGAQRYLAHADGRPIGYIDCGTFDRCTVYGGEGPAGPIILESIEAPTGSIAFVIDPRLRRRGLGAKMIAALIGRSELRFLELFEAGVEPENVTSRRCPQASGVELRSERADFEGMLYYRLRRAASVSPRAQREHLDRSGPGRDRGVSVGLANTVRERIERSPIR
jgi:GNAT superfamily N-acetyltransferase